MMTIHKLTVGDGYTYLTRHIAGGDVDRQRGQDAADYYTAQGNPPGHWIGAGITALGLTAGDVVGETQMRALFGLGLHPDADQIIADHQAAHITAGMTAQQLAEINQQARRQAALGRAFPVYEALAPYEERVTRRLATIAAEMNRPATVSEVRKVLREESARQRAAVAGYDVVFAPVKSAALLWALHDREDVRAAVRAAHDEARNSALRLLEQHAAYTRAGRGGVAQIETHGLVAAAFDHYDSRCGDPNLHTHVVLANKIQGVDGKWRSLDATTLYQMTVAASEHYNTAFETALTARLNVRFTPRTASTQGKQPVREIDAIPAEWIALFSQRRRQVEARYEQLLRDYRQAHDRDPTRAVAHQLARQATVDTREGKKPPRSLATMRAFWTQAIIQAYGPDALTVLDTITTTAVAASSGPFTEQQIDQLAGRVVARVAEARATWTRWNLHAEAERVLRECLDERPFGDLAAHQSAVAAITDRALAPAHSILVDAPPLLDEPDMLRRSDGASVFIRHAAARYTSHHILDAESRLLHAALTPAIVPIPATAVTLVLDQFEANQCHSLNPGQRELVTAFATATRRISVGIGAAGTGKTTAMKALRDVAESNGRRLIPLATSAAAAAVLGHDIGTQAENLHKFVWEHTNAGTTPDRFFQVGAGDLLLVDEAGMAGTLQLERLLTIAERHGANVLLLGDYRQLGAVESGGAFRLLAHEAGATELDTLHRFSNPAEAQATSAIRTGDTTGLDFYQQQGRIHGGSTQAMADAVYQAWQTDVLAGKVSLMIAATNRDITALSARARADRVAAGQVTARGIALADHNHAGVGDWIVTRHNQRTLATNRGRDFVKNGDAWTVERRYADGRLKVRHQHHGGRVVLPAAYVAHHVQLHYATTIHRAQGATVDTAHVLVDDQLSRESLYVALTRGRHANHAYVATHELLPLDEDHRLDRPRHDPDARAAREALEQIIAKEGAALSATETIRRAQQDAGSLATLVPNYLYALERASTARCQSLINIMFEPMTAHAISSDTAFPAVVRALLRGESAGWQPEQLIASAARRGPLFGADSPARLLAWRLDITVAEHFAPAALGRPTVADVARYQAFVAIATGLPAAVLRPDRAMQTPAAMTAETLLDSRDSDHYQALIVQALGPRLTIRAASEPAWSALNAAIRRAELAGHHPVEVLEQVVAQRDLADARSLGEVLAWRINNHLERRPAVPTNERAGAWTHLAWTLKAAEQHGVNLDDLLANNQTTMTSDELLQLLHTAIAEQPQQSRAGALLWLPGASLAAEEAAYGPYITAAAELISARVQGLAEQAADRRPAWTTVFGDPPTDPAIRTQWLAHLGIAAAFRDQYQIPDDTAEQPLGPYIDSGRAGHHAYRAAAESVIRAHHLAHPDRRPPTVDPAASQLAIDVYNALPPEHREAVTAAFAARLGPLALGTVGAGMIHAANAVYLIEILNEHGHLTGEMVICSAPTAASIARQSEHLADPGNHRRAQQSPSPEPLGNGTMPGQRHRTNGPTLKP
jgi:conjugative relaxase-like TrwC/TraI family protein